MPHRKDRNCCEFRYDGALVFSPQASPDIRSLRDDRILATRDATNIASLRGNETVHPFPRQHMRGVLRAVATIFSTKT